MARWRWNGGVWASSQGDKKGGGPDLAVGIIALPGQLGNVGGCVPQWEGRNVEYEGSIVKVLLPQGPGIVGREGSGIISITLDDRNDLLTTGDIIDPVVEITMIWIKGHMTM